MSDLQVEVSRVVQDFVAQVSELARRAALDTLESAFGGRASRSKTTAASRGPVDSTTGRGAKRSPADLEAVARQFTAFVKANPGLRIEQINKQLGTSTRDLALPIRKLISDGVIVARGEKRSTTYLPGKKAN